MDKTSAKQTAQFFRNLDLQIWDTTMQALVYRHSLLHRAASEIYRQYGL